MSFYAVVGLVVIIAVRVAFRLAVRFAFASREEQEPPRELIRQPTGNMADPVCPTCGPGTSVTRVMDRAMCARCKTRLS